MVENKQAEDDLAKQLGQMKLMVQGTQGLFTDCGLFHGILGIKAIESGAAYLLIPMPC